MAIPLYTPEQVRETVAAGARLIEVLPEREYAEQHLPGAIHLPLRRLEEGARELDPSTPVIVYCWDEACDLSPRAAARLERFGFTTVYDYVTGKSNWLVQGQPVEGTLAEAPTAGSIAVREVATCGLDDPVSSISAAYCVVTDADGVVHGIVEGGADLTGDQRAEEVMRPGPSTFRPNVPIDEMASFMVERDLARAPVTTSSGVLLGVIEREDAVRCAQEGNAGH